MECNFFAKKIFYFHRIFCKIRFCVVSFLVRERISSGKIGRSGSILDLLPSAIDAVMSRRSVTWGKEPKSPSKFITYVISELLDDDFDWHEEVIAPAMKNFNESRINDALQARDKKIHTTNIIFLPVAFLPAVIENYYPYQQNWLAKFLTKWRRLSIIN